MKGPYLSHSATSKLVLNIKRLGEPLVQISTASNKKAANAQCALKMVGELYRRNLIERFGEDKIQKPLSPALIGAENESIGEKRKIEGEEEPVQFDENGNWTLELARSRLSEFYQKQEKQLNCDERNSVGKILKALNIEYLLKGSVVILVFSTLLVENMVLHFKSSLNVPALLLLLKRNFQQRQLQAAKRVPKRNAPLIWLFNYTRYSS